MTKRAPEICIVKLGQDAGNEAGNASACAPLITTASTCFRRVSGSRKGPAGSNQPLPNPRTASTTTSSTSRAKADVLQAVVGDQHIHFRMESEQLPRRLGTLAPDPNRAGRTPRQQNRLIANDSRVAVRLHRHHRARAAAITATDDAGRITGLPQPLHQSNRQRGLAGTAHIEIADHDHRHRQALDAEHSRCDRRRAAA